MRVSFKMKPLSTVLCLSLLLSCLATVYSSSSISSSPWDQPNGGGETRRSWLEPKRATVSYPAVFTADWVKKSGAPQREDSSHTLLVSRKSQSSFDDPMEVNPSSRSTFQETSRRPSAWPPWPLSLLTQPSRPSTEAFLDDEPYRPPASVLWSLTRQSVRVGLKNFQTVGIQLWFHLPPAAPPFFMLALIPQKHRIVLPSGEVVMKRAAPLIVNPFARRLAVMSLGLAIMSWSHYELNTRRKQTPLPLARKYRYLNWAILPPFLPEQVTIDVVEQVRQEQKEQEKEKKAFMEAAEAEAEDTPLTVRNRLANVWHGAPRLRATVREWRRMREYRNRERQNAHRLAVMDELVALQTLKKEKEARSRYRKERDGNGTGKGNGNGRHRGNPSEARKLAATNSTEDALGYALVTGASRGIGRAIAVELARWEIPLILVARDVGRLTSLAYDLEACYGVKCCVLPADLSKPGAAELLYKATQKAGLKVDILINNAGFALHGEAVDQDLEQVNDMIQVNALAVSSLTHLYARDMKRRRRGRVMMVSSICGTVAGLPTVAAYAATKAFENVLGISMAKEMEPYGVGVFTLTPGAVKGTDFKSIANDALCWKIPFYPKTPAQVADVGVKLMLRGDTQFTVGWQNRIFLKMLKPALPPRLHNIMAEAAFNPLRSPFARSKLGEEQVKEKEDASRNPSPAQLPSLRPQSGSLPPPRLLQLQDMTFLEEEPISAEETSEDMGESSSSSAPSPATTKEWSSGDMVHIDSTRAQASTSETDTTTTDRPALVPSGQ
jgi:short-subunit dehydrogenase